MLLTKLSRDAADASGSIEPPFGSEKTEVINRINRTLSLSSITTTGSYKTDNHDDNESDNNNNNNDDDGGEGGQPTDSLQIQHQSNTTTTTKPSRLFLPGSFRRNRAVSFDASISATSPSQSGAVTPMLLDSPLPPPPPPLSLGSVTKLSHNLCPPSTSSSSSFAASHVATPGRRALPPPPRLAMSNPSNVKPLQYQLRVRKYDTDETIKNKESMSCSTSSALNQPVLDMNDSTQTTTTTTKTSKLLGASTFSSTWDALARRHRCRQESQQKYVGATTPNTVRGVLRNKFSWKKFPEVRRELTRSE